MRHTRPVRAGQLLACLALVSGGAALLRWAGGPTRTTSRAVPVSGVRFDVPAWAFPRPLPAPAIPLDSVTLLHVPRSAAAFTEVQLRNQFAAPDWHPETHPTMPRVVAHGRMPAVMACAFCHLPDGGGRPENAALAGLPTAYIVQQVADIRSRARQSAWRGPYRPSDLMRTVADSATTAEIADAARYFSRLPLRHRTQVVEAIEVPRTRPGLGLYFPDPGGGVETLGERLIELPVDPSRHERRDAAVGYVAYVPHGSIARGHASRRRNGRTACPRARAAMGRSCVALATCRRSPAACRRTSCGS